MTTDRIQPARPAAPTDRPAQQGAGGAFAALLDAHSAVDTPRPAAREGQPAKRVDDDPAGETAPHTGENAGDEPAKPAQTELGPALEESRPSLTGLPVVGTAPVQPPRDPVATGCAAIVVPVVAAQTLPVGVAAPAAATAESPALLPAAQPVAPAAVPVAQPLGALVAAPPQPVAATPPAPALGAAAPATPTPAAPALAPVASPAPVGAPGESLVPVTTASEPVATPAPQGAPAPPVTAPEPAPAAAAEPQSTSTAPAPQAAAAAPAAAATTAPERAVPLHRAPAAVATLLHVAAERGITHARMALRPAELGGIEIRLQASAAGVAAQVVADSPEAARLLAQAGDDLRRALEARDVTLLSLEVSTSAEQRSRDGARGEGAGEAGPAPGTDRAAAEAAEADAPTTHSVIELPGGLLVDVLA